MTAAGYAVSLPFPKMPPAQRLQEALSMARMNRGIEPPCVVYVHPETFAETDAPDGIELRSEAVRQRFDFRFVAGNDAPKGVQP